MIPQRQPLGDRLLRFGPLVVMGLMVVPLVAGALSTAAPAFGIGAGQAGFGLAAFYDLLAWEGLRPAAGLSLWVGLSSTFLSVALALTITAVLHDRPLFGAIRQSLAPLLALPHAAAALGLAFLIAPSGWVARLLSPWATGWTTPPDLLILNDPWGVALILGLVAKELPFLLLVVLAALPQDTIARLSVTRSLGHGDAAGFFLAVLPAFYPALRLPVLAVLTYSMTSVEMGLVLGPTRPPVLSVQIALWLSDPGLDRTALGSAAALVQLGVTLAGLLIWRGIEAGAAGIGRHLVMSGRRLRGIDRLRPLISGLALGLSGVLVAGIAALALWSVAGLWTFPADWPDSMTLAGWSASLPDLARLSGVTLSIALSATLIALVLSLWALEAESRFGLPPLPSGLLYLPLVLPALSLLPGLARLGLVSGLSDGITAVTLAHLLFVFPYVYFALSGPFRAWDGRIGTIGLTLGARPARVFWRLRLPMLTAPLATAAAIGFAVSVGLYLPSLLIGGGRISTLTTEALALSSGGNRRLTSTYALMQTFWPMLAFALALAAPPVLRRLRLARKV